MPSSFDGSQDTLSMGDVIWEDFFRDPYLSALIEVALSNNPDLLRTIQNIDIARAQLEMRKGALLPSLQGVVFSDINRRINVNAANGNGSQDQLSPRLTREYFVGLRSSWEADLWGKLKSRRQAAYARFLSTEKGRHLVHTTLVSEVARLYYELLGLDNELETIEKNIAFQEVALEMIKIQKIGGRATELAVQQFTAQLLSTRSLGFEKKQRIVETENMLNLLLGRYPQPIARGESILKQHLPEVIRAGVPSDMLLRRPDVQQAEFLLTAASADVDAARAAFLPSFTITPSVGLNAASIPMLFKTPESLAWGLIGGLTAPIINRRQIRADYQQSIARNFQSYYDYQETLLNAYQEVVSSMQRVENYQHIYELKEQEAAMLQQAVTTSNDLFAAGYATYLEVITAQKRVLEAELGMTNTRKEIFLSLIDLYRALGGGWK